MLQKKDTEEIAYQCGTRFYSHGRKTEKVVVLYHGLSNCPQQFQQFGIQLYEQGYNVFIPRIPRHGLNDRLTDQLGNLTAQELINFTSQTIDIARGLGNDLTTVGLSMGGVMNIWAAQERSDLSHVIIIAPNLGHNSDPIWATAITRTGLWYPNQLWWWDDSLKDKIPGPQYAYPRYATRAVAETFKLGNFVRFRSSKAAYSSNKITMVTNKNDNAVSDELIIRQLDLWKERNNTNILNEYQFSASYGLGHDLVDPLQPNAKTDLVYPVLINMIK